MRNKSGILMAVLIVVAFLAFKHHGTPTIAMPASAVVQGTDVKIPVYMQPVEGTNQQWTLTMRQARQYFVNVYNNRKLIMQFGAGIANSPDPTGATYGIQGDIQFGGVLYHAKRLHVDTGGKQGYILFRPDQPSDSPATSNHAGS